MDPTVGVTVSELPVPIEVPPHEPLYHLSDDPLPPVAVNTTELPRQISEALAEAVIGAVLGIDNKTMACAQLDWQTGFSHRA